MKGFLVFLLFHLSFHLLLILLLLHLLLQSHFPVHCPLFYLKLTFKLNLFLHDCVFAFFGATVDPIRPYSPLHSFKWIVGVFLLFQSFLAWQWHWIWSISFFDHLKLFKNTMMEVRMDFVKGKDKNVFIIVFAHDASHVFFLAVFHV